MNIHRVLEPGGCLVVTLDKVGFEVTDLDAIQHVSRALAIASARIVVGLGWERGERKFLSALAGFERVGRWRSRFRTGYFVAVRVLRG